MVAKKAWIPSRGTYSVGISSNPFDPTVGSLAHSTELPAKGLPKSESLSEDESTSVSDLLEGNDDLEAFLAVAGLCNVARVHKNNDGEWTALGDPTEIALQVFASRFDRNRHGLVDGESAKYKQVSEYPFDSDVKKMSVIFEDRKTQEQKVYTKGAVERVLDSCVSVVWDDGQIVDFSDALKEKALEIMEALASQGLRVLALASREYDSRSGRRASRDGPPPRDEIERDLTFRGLIGLYDPPRPESAEAVKRCHRAGIKVHMLTGDHPGTASAIAKQVHILPDMTKVSADVAKSMIMTAKEFDKHTDTEIDQLPVLPLVIARCAPNTKVRMIEALRRREAFMAMVSFLIESTYRATG
jgi:P-type Na+/K+ transporter